MDRITINGIPNSWGANRSVAQLVLALRKQRLLGQKETLVLSILGVGTAQMTRMNAKYRGKRRATDVLSFEQKGAQVKGLHFLGDLVLCLPVVRAQARTERHGVRVETAVLLAHGILHLLGFDHERSPREAARMAKLEAALLRSAGIKTGLLRRSGYK